MKMLKYLPAIIALGFSGVASAAVVTTTSGTAQPPPADVLLQINPTSNISVTRMHYDGAGLSGRREIGQTFQAPSSGSDELTGIVLQVGTPSTSVGAGALGAAFTFNIYQFSSATSFTPISSTPLYTATGNLPASIALGDNIQFNLDTPFVMDPSLFYGVQIGFQGQKSNEFLDFVRGTSSYSSGLGYIAQNSTTVGVLDYSAVASGQDFQITLLTVPEPGVVGLLACGSVGTVFLLRRRGSRKIGQRRF